LKQYEAAISDFNNAIEIDPNDDGAYNNRGNAYGSLKQYETALNDFNKALELNPNLDLSYNNRGNVFSHLKQYETAINDFNKAIELNPYDANAFNNRGSAYSGLEQYEMAIADYNNAIELDPDSKSAIHNRAAALAFQASERGRVEITERLEKDYEKKLDEELKKAEKKFSANLQGNLETLQEKINQHKDTVSCLNVFQYCLLAIWFIGVAVFFYSVFQNPRSFLSASNFLPYVSIALFCSTPIIWSLRITAQNILESKSLKEDASRRMFIENNLIRLAAGDDEGLKVRQKMMSKYYDSWQTNSPVEILLQLNSRRIGPETILDKIFPSQKGTDD
jgi:Tfp pilus assembly protein PilF